MKKTGFRKQSYEEVKAKQLAKRQKMSSKGVKPKKGNKVAKKVKSLAKWKTELDTIFSKYIRYRDDGQCFTCPKKDDPQKMQNGHFVPRQYLAVRWDEKNCNCQCYACNMLYGGQGATYAVRLAQKYGQETVDYLESQRWVSVKLDESWYQEQIAKYKALHETQRNTELY